MVAELEAGGEAIRQVSRLQNRILRWLVAEYSQFISALV
jgi:hypothetical protein